MIDQFLTLEVLCPRAQWIMRRLLRQRKSITIRPKINSNDFGSFWKLISRFEFEFGRRGIFFELFDFFGVFKVQSHTMWPYMCLHQASSCARPSREAVCFLFSDASG